jgi:moderate conductance mechanosensitive channel
VWGVEAFGNDEIVIRLVVKTKPLVQWKVARQLRGRLKAAFDEAGIEIPFPQRTLWLRTPVELTGSKHEGNGEDTPEA